MPRAGERWLPSAASSGLVSHHTPGSLLPTPHSGRGCCGCCWPRASTGSWFVDSLRAPDQPFGQRRSPSCVECVGCSIYSWVKRVHHLRGPSQWLITHFLAQTQVSGQHLTKSLRPACAQQVVPGGISSRVRCADGVAKPALCGVAEWPVSAFCSYTLTACSSGDAGPRQEVKETHTAL